MTLLDLDVDALRDAPLGHPVRQPDHYAPDALFAVPREPQRAALGLAAPLPFTGVDVWTAYELTWLDTKGKPQVALATIEFPVDSPALIESKSMKLYLGSFAQSRHGGLTDVAGTIERDLSRVAGARIGVTLRGPAAFGGQAIRELPGESLDDLAVTCDAYDVMPGLLHANGDVAEETLTTRLFRSVCPVTAQPDIASVQLSYRGPRIEREGLLRYLVSYRRHAGFHEHCIERIFVDVLSRCRCEQLTVLARFTRRGGLDINPFRTNAGVANPDNVRTARQ
ncbi:MAG TPA: NADPH-dependent 7-cyano-7-deazaguanine reductase QueF [Casimicrobiaceae bacterium]|nr:NADPH-dependent 7-cyano-7-deazaguanine reductase QueF [Casimicrobiaceae bacterium]